MFFTLQNHPRLPEFHGQEHDFCMGKKTEKEIIKIFYGFYKKSNSGVWHDPQPFNPPKWFDLEHIASHWAVKFVTKKEDF